MQNLIFKGLNGHFKIAAATQYITRIKDSTKNVRHTLRRRYFEIFSGGGPVHARVPIHAHPQFS